MYLLFTSERIALVNIVPDTFAHRDMNLIKPYDKVQGNPLWMANIPLITYRKDS